MSVTKWTVLLVMTVAVFVSDQGTAAAARRVYKRGWFGREVYREHWLGDAGAGVLTHLITTAGTVAGPFVSGLSGGGSTSNGESQADAESAKLEAAHLDRAAILTNAENRADRLAAQLGISVQPPRPADAASDPGSGFHPQPDRKSKPAKKRP